jgi:molecular chaperone GrpE
MARQSDQDTPRRNEGGEPVAQAQETKTIEEQLQVALAQVSDVTDKYKRSVAEFSNYRKRQEREWNQQRGRITMDVLTHLLPLMDDLDLALANVPEEIAAGSVDTTAWIEGIALIRHKLDGVLDSYGVKPIEPVGQPFDPLFHEALIHAPSDEYDAGVVMAELRKGYLMGDQVLRPARVAVSSGSVE